MDEACNSWASSTKGPPTQFEKGITALQGSVDNTLSSNQTHSTLTKPTIYLRPKIGEGAAADNVDHEHADTAPLTVSERLADHSHNALDFRSHQIRLLKILPARDGAGMICCNLKTADLDDGPNFTALSYAWGSPHQTRDIHLNGRRTTVRKNLCEFLKNARSFVQERPLWIDALCIDQANKKVRIHQVSFMATIYHQATEVVAWLGPSYEDSELAMRALRVYERSYRKTYHNSRMLWDTEGNSLRNLCRRPYWTRLWIFQELVMARRIRIMCGRYVIDWETLEDALTPRRTHGAGSEHPSKEVFAIARDLERIVSERSTWYLGRRSTEYWGLLTLMENTRHMHCTEIRDRAYSLLAVAGADDDSITIDYDTPILTLAHQILRAEHVRYLPNDVVQILKQCRLLENLLKLERGSMQEVLEPYKVVPQSLAVAFDEGPFPPHQCWEPV